MRDGGILAKATGWGWGDLDPLFWGALVAALAVAFLVTVRVNHAMIGRGKGHAVVHQMHEAHHEHF